MWFAYNAIMQSVFRVVEVVSCAVDRVVVRSRSQIVKPDALFVVFLAVHNSSIGDLVTD